MEEKELLKIIEEAARDGRTELNLSGQGIKSLPAEIVRLRNLKELDLGGNQLTSVPKELGQLTYLEILWLDVNQLTSVPNELGRLRNLQELWLYGNQLTSVPKELGQLTNLMELYLAGNQLTSVPKELGQLTNLERLWLGENQLTSVPKELGQLTNLRELRLEGNPLESPPPEVVKQGMKAILAYLRELQIGEGLKWEAKLLIVGEAGVGKTELVKALLDEEFGGESATEGILIRTLNIQRPKQPRVKMQLNLWDFGGQEIQHATHQFFYSERALFLLAWNARENYEQAKLNDWLELIQARASVEGNKKDEKQEWRVPVLMVATHCDLWRPDIPYEELKRQFPGIRFLGLIKVSNKQPRNGIENLRRALAEAASNLPLMGMRWPNDWQEVENTLSVKVENKESRMGLGELWNLMDAAKVSEGSREILIRVLDGMGKIRVFLDDEQLRDTVVLNPQWLTNRIARVLKNQDKEEKPICKHAILKRNQWPIFWPDESEETHRMFVRMMRNFDLVYELEDSPDEGWLVVQHLPYQLSKGKRLLQNE